MIIGLTGGIGSGKTWVSSLFKDLGIPVYISDVEAKKIMHTNIDVKKSIIALFGEESYTNEKLNKSLIAEKVFENKELLNQLNKIVHPAVAVHFEDWYRNQNKPFVIKESAILFEIGAEKKCNAVILVTAPVNERIRRIEERDEISKELIKKRMNNQWTDNRKIPLADYIIENTIKENTRDKVKEIHKHILNSPKKC